MNSPLWRCTDRRHDPLGTLGATEAEANVARLAQYKAKAVRPFDERAFCIRWLKGMAVKRRARYAGMRGALDYVTTLGERIATLGARPPKPEVEIRIDTSGATAAFDRICKAVSASSDTWRNTARHGKE